MKAKRARSEVQNVLRKMRVERKIGLVEISRRIGISRQSMWERETKVTNPSWTHVTSYLKGCDATLIELAYRMLDVPIERYVIADENEVREVELLETPSGFAFMDGRETLLWGNTIPELLERVPADMRLYRLIR